MLRSPIVVAIFFQNDNPSFIAKAEEFYGNIGNSGFWSALQEYGITRIAANDVHFVTVPMNAPSTIDDSTDGSPLETWLQSEIGAGTLPSPDSSGDTVYAINYPPGTTVTGGGTSCVDYAGYHSDMQLNDPGKTAIPYIVVPRCPPGLGLMTVLDVFTTTASHELVEASTNPLPDYQPAWDHVDAADFFLDAVHGGSEIGDMCQDDPQAYETYPDFPFAVQRFWSNGAAAAGHDPCVPMLPGETFFNAVPVASDMIPFTEDGQTYVQAKGVRVPIGQSKTIPLELYSDGPIDPWSLAAQDLRTLNGIGAANLSVGLSSAMGSNGQTVQITITAQAAGANGTEKYAIVSSTPGSSGSMQHIWYGLVGN